MKVYPKMKEYFRNKLNFEENLIGSIEILDI